MRGGGARDVPPARMPRKLALTCSGLGGVSVASPRTMHLGHSAGEGWEIRDART
jgi:hypothetical protein